MSFNGRAGASAETPCAGRAEESQELQARQAIALRGWHLILDAVLIVASMAMTAVLHAFLRNATTLVRETPPFQEYASLVYLVLPIWLSLIAILRLDRSFERLSPQSELFLRLGKLHVFGLMGLLLIQFVTQSVVNRSLVALFLSCTFVVLYLERIALGVWIRYQHRSGHDRLRLLLVGRLSKRMGDFVRDAQRHPLPPAILGYLCTPLSGAPLSLPPEDIVPIPCIGSTDDLARVLHEQPVDHVMFFPPSNHPDELEAELAECEQLAITASFSVDLIQIARATPRLSSMYEHPFVTFDSVPKPPEWLALKYGTDPLAAALLLLLLSPLLLTIALAILLSMGRPVLFWQRRVGLYGRHFRMPKFRTMVPEAEAEQPGLLQANEMQGPVFKIKKDKRVTTLGRLLRRTSLDELPQLLNVLTGSMSLVGPRPLPLGEQEQIRGWQRRRLSMKPGITGLWQVSGRSQLDFQEWMALDLKYVEEWSLWLDLLILLRTLPVVVTGRGAY
jgi:exopolysaccharide biosynthesis polyprenyl glycosylphosphotransferase